jgi:RimJ/RimL family protein N-acetyltransferase
MYLVPSHQKAGFGPELLLAAERWLEENRSDVLCIKAEVLDRNQTSHRLFRMCGYQRYSSLYVKKVQGV